MRQALLLLTVGMMIALPVKAFAAEDILPPSISAEGLDVDNTNTPEDSFEDIFGETNMDEDIFIDDAALNDETQTLEDGSAKENISEEEAAQRVLVAEMVDGYLEAMIGGVKTGELQSLVFTYWEHLEIEDAKASIGKVTVTETKVQESKVKPPPEKRFIHLEGILYTNANDWVIWLNGKQYRPKALPEESLGLIVYPDYIEVKWYDDYTNQIIPVRLRPMQRFNIDARVFMPG